MNEGFKPESDSMAGRQLDLIASGSGGYSFGCRLSTRLGAARRNANRFQADARRGSGAMEIRAHSENEFRVLYVARFEEAVYVLHCFVKKTRATRKADIDLGKQRYAAMLELRRSK
jgi:hypothetical protein